jgi:DNA-binding protein H-NS
MVRATNGIDDLSYAQLLALQEKIAAAIVERKSEDAQLTKQKLKEMAEKAGFDINELFGKKRAKSASLVKYRDPSDNSRTWSGRGRKPNWLVDAVKKGAKLEKFAV